MPPVTNTNLLVTELGAAFIKAHNANKDKPPVKDTGGELPAPFDGIAKLIECRMQKIAKGKENEGKIIFYAAGIVQQPEEVEIAGVRYRVQGKRTQVTEPIFDTPSKKRITVDDHIGFVYNILKNLGIPVGKLNPTDVEKTMATIIANKDRQPIYFSFRTWKGPKQTTGPYAGKEPMVNHVWIEKVDYKPVSGAVSATVGVKDGSGIATTPAPVVNVPIGDSGDAPPDHLQPDTDTYDTVTTDSTTDNNGDNGADSGGTNTDVDLDKLDQGDLSSILKSANDGDLQAQQDLMDAGLKLGLSNEEVNKAPTWQDLYDLIKSKSAPKKDDTPAEEEIKVGDQFNYKPMDLKTKKQSETPVLVEVIALNVGKDGAEDTVNLRNVSNKKMVYMNVALNHLEDVK